MSTIGKITHAKARQRLTETMNRPEVVNAEITLGQAVAYLVSAAGAVVAVQGQDAVDGHTRASLVEEVQGFTAQCFALAGQELGPQTAGAPDTVMSREEALVSLVNQVAGLHHFYHRSASAFEVALRRLWYFLLQHEEILAGPSDA